MRLSFPSMGCCFLLGSCLLVSPGLAQPQSNVVYHVEKIIVEYGPRGATPHPGLPPVQELLKEEFIFAQSGGVYLEPRAGAAPAVLTLDGLAKPVRFSEGALNWINQVLCSRLNRRGIVAVMVTPDSADIEPGTGEDLREGRQDLHLLIYVGEVKQLRTVAKGKRIPMEEAINHSAHRRIAANSPLQPGHDSVRGSLLDKPRLDDYVGRLNRFPGRGVDAAISSTGEPGGVVLDYLVSEDKPWVAYFQAANTGTESSGEWRERFGFIHQQLTGRDDILSLDYITTEFSGSQAGFGSYELPVVYPDRLKVKAYGSSGKFTSDDVGVAFEQLHGTMWTAGSELVFSPFSLPNFDLGRLAFAPTYVDLSLGAKWQGIDVDNETFGQEGHADLFLPYAAFNLSSISQKTKFSVGAQVEGNWGRVAGTDAEDLPPLGRADPDKDWVLLKAGGSLSFFLEPLFAPGNRRLANEFSISARGQYVFDNRRLIPQQEELVGGFYSVRGYREAFDAGDDAYVGSAEYRLYLARLLAPSRQVNVAIGSKTSARTQFGSPFRFRPKDIYGRPDWDLIFRTFVDGGQTFNNQRKSYETDRSLLSCGVGLELQIRRNFNIRCDYGVALKAQRGNLSHPVDVGDSRLHFTATLAW